MKNIELFNVYVAKIFDKLYNEFPLGVDIEVCKFIDKDIDPFSLEVPKECKILEYTFYFLRDEGFIRFKEGNNHYFLDVVLTSKALMLLKQTPKSVKENISIIDTIKHWLKEGNLELVRKSVDMFFKMILE